MQELHIKKNTMAIVHTHTHTDRRAYTQKENRVLYIYFHLFVASVFSCFVLLFLFNHVCCLLDDVAFTCYTELYILLFFFLFLFLFQCAFVWKASMSCTCAVVFYFLFFRFVFKSLCRFKRTFLTLFGNLPGHLRSFVELRLLFCLPVKGVSSLKGNSLKNKKNHRICKKEEELATIHCPVGLKRGRGDWRGRS